VSCYAALGVRLDPASANSNRLTSGEVTRLSSDQTGSIPVRFAPNDAASPSGLSTWL